MKLRILLTADPGLPVPPLLYGGIERIIASLAQELEKRGHVVALVADKQSVCGVDELFPWPDLPASGRNAARFMATLSSGVRSFRPDLLHSFSRLLFMASLLPRRIPKVMSFQREPTRATVKWAARLAGRSLHFTGCSDYISDRGRTAGGRWSTIHNFVDVRHYTFKRAVAADAPLVFLSRVERIKGAHTAIEACRRAGRKLIIAGNHADDNSESGRYWREAIAPNIDGNAVQYVGPVNDEQKNELLGKAAAMIVPIEWEEPFGIVFVEALACGTPVISCARGALPEIVQHGVHGFLVRSIAERVEAVRQLPSISRAACRARAERHFSSAVAGEAYLALYRELCGKHGA